MGKPTKTDAVARNALGQVVAGSGAINPGGLSKAEREARDAVRLLFATKGATGLHDEGIAAYRRCLQADNPAIVKDFMDRLAGPVKSRVEVSDDPDAPPLFNATLEQILEIVRSGK